MRDRQSFSCDGPRRGTQGWRQGFTGPIRIFDFLTEKFGRAGGQAGRFVGWNRSQSDEYFWYAPVLATNS